MPALRPIAYACVAPDLAGDPSLSVVAVVIPLILALLPGGGEAGYTFGVLWQLFGTTNQLTAGLALARRDTVVRRCLVSIATFSLVSLVFVGQFPVVAERNLGIDERSAAYGWLYACFGIGGVSGALAVGSVLSKIRRERMVSPALVAYSVMLGTFALVRSPALGYPLIFLVGLTYFTFLTALSTVLQERVTNRERGRITALWIMGFGGTVPVGNLLAGPIIEATTVTAVLLAGAVSAFGLAFYTRYTRLDAPARLDSRAELDPKAA